MTHKVAVIGAGSMGKHHARIYADMPGVTLVGVADVNEQAAAEVARRAGTKAYADYRMMLSVERPDVVNIVVPTIHHREVALEVIAHGCHLLVEKPIALTENEAQDILRAAADKHVLLMVGHVERFNPAIRELKRRIKERELGRLIHIEARRQGPFPSRVQDVGVVIDLAVHDIDVMCFVADSTVERVFAETMGLISANREDILAGTLRMKSGVMGTLSTNWITPTKIRELSVTGDRGMFTVNYLTQDLFFFENASTLNGNWESLDILRGVSEGRMIRHCIARKEPLQAELEEFLAAIRGEIPIPVTGEDGIAAVRVARALLQSAETHQVTDIRP